MSDSDSDAGVPLREPISPSASPKRGASGKTSTASKRKRVAESEEPELEDVDSDAGTAAKAANASKKQKKKQKKSKKEVARDEALDEKLGVNHALAHMDGQLLADHIAQRLRRFEGEKISGIEEEELRVPAPAIKDTTSWTKDRTLPTLPDFMIEFSQPRRRIGKNSKKTLSNASVEKGTPHTLVIASSGIRAADVTRALRSFQSQSSFVAKLFAKHIKLKEAIETVKNTRMGIGVGTPQRVMDLMDAGSLKIDSLERIVIDASAIDVKKRGILDMRETLGPLVRLLARKELKERYAEEGDKQIELFFF